MNLVKLFPMQKVLDDRIVKEKGLEGQDLLDKKILALQVELGELANELPEVFKFWANKKNNYEKALKEYVDGLHFFLSIGLELRIPDEFDLTEVGQTIDVVDGVIGSFSRLFFYIDSEMDGHDWFEALEYYKGLGFLLGFTWEQIEQAYISKNEINHSRQSEGY